MDRVRTAMIVLPLLLASSSAFADSADEKEQGAEEPQTPGTEPTLEISPAAPRPPKTQMSPPASAPAPPQPTIGTTQTTSAYAEGGGMARDLPGTSTLSTSGRSAAGNRKTAKRQHR